MDKIVHGLDLPMEITEKNIEITMKELGITEEDIDNVEIEYED